jgi:hypothetical protein
MLSTLLKTLGVKSTGPEAFDDVTKFLSVDLPKKANVKADLMIYFNSDSTCYRQNINLWEAVFEIKKHFDEPMRENADIYYIPYFPGKYLIFIDSGKNLRARLSYSLPSFLSS